MEQLKCDKCGIIYADMPSIESAKRTADKWEALVRKDGDEPRGISPCPIITCPGELILENRAPD